MDHFSAYATSPLFRIGSIKQLKERLERLEITEESFEAAATIVDTGMVLKDVPLVLEGSVVLYADHTRIARYEAGSCPLAHLAASRERSKASLVAQTPVTMAWIGYDPLIADGDLARNYAAMIAGDLEKTSDRLLAVLQPKVKDKLMWYLRRQKEIRHASTFVVPYNRTRLAAYLGVTPVALAKEIKALEATGWLKTDGNRFTLSERYRG